MELQWITIAIVILINIQVKVHGDESETCGKRLIKHEALVVHGFEAKDGDIPWYAGILHFDLLIVYMKMGRPILPARVIVQLGRNNLKVSGVNSQEFEAYQIFVHHGFNAGTLRNDIAIIRLATRATLNNYIQPICLWDSNDIDISNVVGKPGIVAGFGITETNKISFSLIQASMPVVSLTTCLDSNRDFYGHFLSDYTFCAGYRNGTTACNGDSGSGLIFEENGVHRIRGIVSLTQVRPGNTQGLCKIDEYVIFTDVAKYLPWIMKMVPGLPSAKVFPEIQNWQYSKLICKFGWNDGEKRYECVDNSFSSTANNVKILTVDGTFDDGKTYSDVNTVIINSGSTTYVPEMSALRNIFANFERLFITNSQLKYVERSKLSKLSQLKILNFYGNRITTLDEDILYDLPDLEIFAFVQNRIRILPDNLISRQFKLKELWAYENQIEYIPRNFFQNNKELTHLWLGYNSFKKIDANFNELRNLIVLDFRSNDCIDEQACAGCATTFSAIQDIIDRHCK